MTSLDRSHDPARVSWVDGASPHEEFPIQNLPFGKVTAEGGGPIVVAIGNHALPLDAAFTAGWGAELSADARVLGQSLNAFAALEPAQWTAVRLALSDALSDPAWRARLEPLLVPRTSLQMTVPFAIGDYTDFYASIYHATNVGSMFRPDNPLLPNYKWMPIGYHGRASSIVVSGTPVRRPHGQLNSPGSTAPQFLSSRSLDYELELALYVGGANPLGEPVTGDTAASRLFGVGLLNDWSARDIQAWEYQPLGPFLAKNFASSVSPWVVTVDALRPFRIGMPPRPAGDPAPLDHLTIADDWTLQADLGVSLVTAAMRRGRDAPAPISDVAFAEAMYWSPLQLIAHHGSNGCNLQPGDMLGTGTVSGPAPDARGCLLERTWRGAEPLLLPNGERRTFLEDGDEVIMRGRCHASSAVPIGLGECRGIVMAAE